MHHRLANEIVRIEKKYPNPMSADEIFQLLDHFRYIIPAGSPMTGIGNNHQVASLSNCFVVGIDGESRPTRAVWGDPTAVTAPSLYENRSPYAVYDIAGRRIATQNAGKGVVIVKKNGKAKKILVK